MAGSVQQQQGRGAMFAAACGALSRYVKAAAVVEAPRPAAVVLPLMPGAPEEEPEAAGPPAQPQQQLTISYGGRVVVVDDVPAGKAAELVRAAAAAQGPPRVLREGDLPMARKASLQRFMEKRKGRAAARAAPYTLPDAAVAAAAPSFPEDHLALAL